MIYCTMADRPIDRQTDIATYRAAIAAKKQESKLLAISKVFIDVGVENIFIYKESLV